MPLKDEHVTFFHDIIIPLHKVQTNLNFLDELVNCVKLFLNKDPSLCLPFLQSILKFWPFANAYKEAYFIDEVSVVIAIIDPNDIKGVVGKLTKRIFRCLSGDNLNIMDRTSWLFQDEEFRNIIKIYKEETYPIMVPIINELATNHWHSVIQLSFQDIVTILKEIDSSAYELALNTNVK